MKPNEAEERKEKWANTRKKSSTEKSAISLFRCFQTARKLFAQTAKGTT
jgi:hypothetical protein